MRHGRIFMLLNMFLIVCSNYLPKYVIILKLAKVCMFRSFKIKYSLLVSKIFSRVLVIKFASYRKLSVFLSLLSIFIFIISNPIHRLPPGPSVVRVPAGARALCRLKNVKTSLKRTQSYSECVLGAKRPECEVDHSPSCNAELSMSGAISTS